MSMNHFYTAVSKFGCEKWHLDVQYLFGLRNKKNEHTWWRWIRRFGLLKAVGLSQEVTSTAVRHRRPLLSIKSCEWLVTLWCNTAVCPPQQLRLHVLKCSWSRRRPIQPVITLGRWRSSCWVTNTNVSLKRFLLPCGQQTDKWSV